MNIDKTKVQCDSNTLKIILQAVAKIDSTHVYMLSMYNKLTLATCNTTNNYDPNTLDTIQVSIPYKGKKQEAFVSTKALLASFVTKSSGLMQLTGHTKPVTWIEGVPPRCRELCHIDRVKMYNSLDYLLRVKHSKKDKRSMAGVIATKGELIATDGKRIHVDNTQPSFVQFTQDGAPARRMIGIGALQALKYLLGYWIDSPILEIEGGYQNLDDHTSGFVFLLKEGDIEVKITSKPCVSAVDTAKGRPSGDENNGTFTVYTDHLESVLSHGINKARGKEVPSVVLTHTKKVGVEMLKAYLSSNFVNEIGVNQTRDEGEHELVASFTSGFSEGRHIELDARYLQQAIKGLGSVIQFVLPAHPKDGLKHCYLNPLYVTGDPGRFAVLCPMCDKNTVEQVNQERSV